MKKNIYFYIHFIFIVPCNTVPNENSRKKANKIFIDIRCIFVKCIRSHLFVEAEH